MKKVYLFLMLFTDCALVSWILWLAAMIIAGGVGAGFSWLIGGDPSRGCAILLLVAHIAMIILCLVRAAAAYRNLSGKGAALYVTCWGQHITS